MAVFEQRDEWLTQRKRGIGGTDISAILNLNPWKNPLDVYLGKVGLTTWQEPNEAMYWGTKLESLIAERYEMDLGFKPGSGAVVREAAIAPLFPGRAAAWNAQTIVEHENYPFFLGTPDGIVSAVDRGLEIKNTSYQGQEWGKPGTDQVPQHYLIQCAWYMSITNLPTWDLAVLFSGSRLGIYTIHRNFELEKLLIEAGRQFWHDHVEQQVPPPIDGSESWSRYLTDRFRIGTERVIEVNPSTDEGASFLKHLEAWRDASERKSAADRDEALAKNYLMNLVGEAKGAKGPFGKVTWIRPRPTQAVDYEAAFKALSELFLKLNQDRRRDVEEIAQAHTAELAKAPYLRFFPAKEKAAH